MWVTVTAKEDMSTTFEPSTNTTSYSSLQVVGMTLGNFDFVDDIVTSYTVPLESPVSTTGAMKLMFSAGVAFTMLSAIVM